MAEENFGFAMIVNLSIVGMSRGKFRAFAANLFTPMVAVHCHDLQSSTKRYIHADFLACTAAALFAYRAQTPGGTGLLVFNLIWQVSSLISEMRPSGDLGKAYKATKQPQRRRN